MDERRTDMSVPLREDLLKEIAEFAARERKRTREVIVVILEWSVARMREVGSVNRLLRCEARLRDGPPQGVGSSRRER